MDGTLKLLLYSVTSNMWLKIPSCTICACSIYMCGYVVMSAFIVGESGMFPVISRLVLSYHVPIFKWISAATSFTSLKKKKVREQYQREYSSQATDLRMKIKHLSTWHMFSNVVVTIIIGPLGQSWDSC